MKKFTLILFVLFSLAINPVTVVAEEITSGFARPDCAKSELQYGMCFAKDLKKAARIHHQPKFQDAFNTTVKQAQTYLDAIAPAPTKVIITDLDETLVDATGYYAKYGKWTPETWETWHKSKLSKAYNKPVLELLKTAKAKGFSVMFITGRPFKQTVDTVNQLSVLNWDGGFLKPVGDVVKIKSQLYKTEVRNMLRKLGYEIVLQIADQPSDFDDDPIEPTQGEFLLPNVMYRLY